MQLESLDENYELILKSQLSTLDEIIEMNFLIIDQYLTVDVDVRCNQVTSISMNNSRPRSYIRDMTGAVISIVPHTIHTSTLTKFPPEELAKIINASLPTILIKIQNQQNISLAELLLNRTI